MNPPTARSQLRCSAVARELGANAAGTAGSYTRVLLVEHPLPWPADALELPALAPVAAALAGRRNAAPTRVQLTVPRRPDVMEVTLYSRPTGPFRRFSRACSAGDHLSVARRALELLSSDQPPDDPGPIELLVCTHGKRDQCCGSLGTSVHSQTAARFAGAREISVRRTSHLGGHRFAPTVCLLPSGTLWAWVTPQLLGGIVDRSLAVDVAVGHYRGTMGLDCPEAQVADAALLGRFGWKWLDEPRSGTVVERGGADVVVEIRHGVVGRESVSHVTLRRTGEMPVPACGKGVVAGGKREPQWLVSAVSTTATPP